MGGARKVLAFLIIAAALAGCVFDPGYDHRGGYGGGYNSGNYNGGNRNGGYYSGYNSSYNGGYHRQPYDHW